MMIKETAINQEKKIYYLIITMEIIKIKKKKTTKMKKMKK